MASVIVNIDVPDLTAGRAFYEGGLGFGFVRLLFGGAVAELRAQGTGIYLIEQTAGSVALTGANEGAAIRRDYGDHWTPVHLDVVVEDLDQALRRALAAGAVQCGEVAVRDWGKLAPLRDPFGHGVCLLQFLGAGYDQVADEGAPRKD